MSQTHFVHTWATLYARALVQPREMSSKSNLWKKKYVIPEDVGEMGERAQIKRLHSVPFPRKMFSVEGK